MSTKKNLTIVEQNNEENTEIESTAPVVTPPRNQNNANRIFHTESPLAAALFTLFQPLRQALDGSQGDSDHGHTPRSMTDGQVKNFLENQLRFLHVALRDKWPNATTEFPNMKEQCDRSDVSMERLISRYGGDVDAIDSDPQAAATTYWYNVNHTRFEVFQEWENALKLLYREWYREDYKYTPIQRRTNVPKTALGEALAKYKAHNEARAN